MVERKITSVTAPSGVVVELKEYITAGEFLDLTEESEKQNLSKTQSAQKILESVIVTIDGSKENIPARLRDLPVSDYVFLNKIVAEIANGNFQKEK